MRFTIATLTLATIAVAMPAPDPQRGNWGGGRTRATQAASSTPAVAVADGANGAVQVPAGTAASTQPAVAAVDGSVVATGEDARSSSSTASSPGGSSGGGHTLTVNNRCGSGHVEWRYNGADLMQFTGTSLTWDKPIEAGVMWLQDYDGIHCLANGDNCGIVEFTLGAAADYNAINYSLLHGSIAGNHILRAPMMIALTGGGCDVPAPGVCTGMTEAECPSGFTGEDTESGKSFPVCVGKNVGIEVTFCP